MNVVKICRLCERSTGKPLSFPDWLSRQVWLCLSHERVTEFETKKNMCLGILNGEPIILWVKFGPEGFNRLLEPGRRRNSGLANDLNVAIKKKEF